MVVNRHFWKDKKVLLTGHTGFKGSWLSLWLQYLGACVTGYSFPPPTIPSLFEVADVKKEMKSVQGDVRDLNHLTKVIDEYKPEIVIHMAAQSLVQYSYINPVETYSTNVMGTVNVLEAVRNSGCVRVVMIVTSDKCYKNNEWLWGYRENEPMGGHDPYSSSKGCAELVTDAYFKSYLSKNIYKDCVAVASVRAGNVIGGGDWSENRLISDIMKSFMSNRPVIIRNPDSIRPWQYVLEPLSGYLCLCERLWEKGAEFSGAWNFGPSDIDTKEVSWIVETMIGLWGKGASWKSDSTEHPHEATYLKLDCSKAMNLLGWSPKTDLLTALERIIQWYRNYSSDRNMRDFSETEISKFENIS